MNKKQWWARKRTHNSCEGTIEKSVPQDYQLSSLGKPNGDPGDGFFYPTLTLYYIVTEVTSQAMWYYTIIDFNEVVMIIYLPE